ncbi:MAG: hypothetical protein IT559_02555 [Alphaproteobacteria bacterium]|nr:hypothetical protein [Alphaproteobacteria bacterium]
MTDSNDYEVGHGKPPKHTRFKPGVSGNPKGKPRKNRTFEEEVQAVLSTRVPVTINGKKTYVTKRQLLLEQIINGAINKNPTMMRLALPLLRMSDGAPDFEILPEDQKTLQALMKNFNSDGSESE